MAASIYVLSYDIADDKRRRRIAKLMEGNARRVQKSVFETYVSWGQVMELVNKALPFLSPSNGDSLRVYRICGACAQKTHHLGGRHIEWEEAIIV